MSKPVHVDLIERGEVWRVYCVLSARNSKWDDRFLRLYLGGDPARLPPAMADDAREIRECIKAGRGLPAWTTRPTIDELNGKGSRA